MTTDFSRHVLAIAERSPHACIMEWGRLIDLAGRDFFRNLEGRPPRHVSEIEEAISRDARFGSLGGALFHTMRHRRNAVTHEPGVHVSRNEAIEFARHALRLSTALQFGYSLFSGPLIAVEPAA